MAKDKVEVPTIQIGANSPGFAFGGVIYSADSQVGYAGNATKLNVNVALDAQLYEVNGARKEFQNISFLPDQYEEAVVRLYLHFANFKIETLINRFEQQEKKDFSLLQQVEDLKKKKEIYQNTI